jgi:hypothetical protein
LTKIKKMHPSVNAEHIVIHTTSENQSRILQTSMADNDQNALLRDKTLFLLLLIIRKVERFVYEERFYQVGINSIGIANTTI